MKLLISLLFFISFNVAATEVTHLRDDNTIPDKCKTNQISDFFADDLEYYTYSRTSDRRSKFDYELDITRKEIRKFWDMFRGGNHLNPGAVQWAEEDETRLKYYTMMLENFEIMDFDFSEEGQVLEILTLLNIKSTLSADMYITGSVAYSGNRSRNRIGELDIVVGDAESCKIIYVGEVKVNPRRVGKARSQLHRFKSFVENEKRH